MGQDLTNATRAGERKDFTMDGSRGAEQDVLLASPTPRSLSDGHLVLPENGTHSTGEGFDVAQRLHRVRIERLVPHQQKLRLRKERRKWVREIVTERAKPLAVVAGHSDTDL